VNQLENDKIKRSKRKNDDKYEEDDQNKDIQDNSKYFIEQMNKSAK